MFWQEAENGTVNCALCPHGCEIPHGKAGLCRVRENIGGRLCAAGYGRISGVALDPVEKKPLSLFQPGKRVLSVGGYGCDLRCPFCQNSEISTEFAGTWRSAETLTPETVVRLAGDAVPVGNIGAAYTYNEPLVGYEFVYDCARLVRGAGLLNIVVTNGYISREPLEALLPFIDAMNIDLKAFSDRFYKKLGGTLAPVREAIELAHARCHVEITTLIVPGENDSEEEIGALARWLASLDTGIPLHLTRFFPRHRYADRAPTPRETIERLRVVAGRYLANVFTGNMARAC